MSGAIAATASARAIFDRAGFSDGAEPPGVGDLANALFGDGALCYSERGTSDHSQLLAGPCISVRSDLDDAQTSLAIARSLARWWLTRDGEATEHEAIEDLAIALLLPPVALREAREAYGVNVAAIADTMTCPPWVVRRALRVELVAKRDAARLRVVAC